MQRRHIPRSDFFVRGKNKKLTGKTLEKMLHDIGSMVRVNTRERRVDDVREFALEQSEFLN